MEERLKLKRTYTIKKLLTSELQSPKSKVKIAKKIISHDEFPIPNSIQEDFLLETEEFPTRFLTAYHSHPTLEVITSLPTIDKRLLSPTDVIGSFQKYQAKANKERISVVKNFHKCHGSFIKTQEKLPSMDLDEKINTIKKATQAEPASPHKILTPGARIHSQQQTKSLERFRKQKKYWDKLEINIAERLEKIPEDLTINSGRVFIARQKEIDIIDRLYKSNTIMPISYWRNSLREGLYSTAEPELQISPPQANSPETTPRYTRDLLRYTRTTKFGRTMLSSSPYFQTKLKEYEKNKEDILNYIDGQELVVHGVNKIRMEYDAAKKVGVKCVKFNPAEPFCDENIETKYNARVLY